MYSAKYAIMIAHNQIIKKRPAVFIFFIDNHSMKEIKLPINTA